MGKNLQRMFMFATNMNNECWDGLEFQELVAGDNYISLPIPGDNSKPGSGFRNGYHLFEKIQSVKQGDEIYNSVELKNGRLTHTRDEMPVIKIE
jgi:hypothetical protein